MKTFRKCLIAIALLFLMACVVILTVLIWKYSTSMREMSYFDLYGGIDGETESPQFVSISNPNILYEAIEVPRTMTREMLVSNISLKDYDDIVKTEEGKEYYVFFSPLQTDDDYVLIVPTSGDFWPSYSRPFGYYAKRIQTSLNENIRE